MLYASKVTLAEANQFIADHHRHRDPVRFHLFSVGVRDTVDDRLCGVAVVMRPVAPAYNGMPIAEVSRVATDGTKNACSFLLSRAARAAFALGYEMIQTYTMSLEPGTSLIAAGWEYWGRRRSAPWDSKSRARKDKGPVVPKDRWVKVSPELERRVAKNNGGGRPRGGARAPFPGRVLP